MNYNECNCQVKSTKYKNGKWSNPWIEKCNNCFNNELKKQRLELEKQRLELEKQKLELERQSIRMKQMFLQARMKKRN